MRDTAALLLSDLDEAGRRRGTRTHNRWFWRPVLYQIELGACEMPSPRPVHPFVAFGLSSAETRLVLLFGLSVQCVPALAGAVLAKLEATGVVLLVLASCVCPRLALGAGELDDRTSVYFCHLVTR